MRANTYCLNDDQRDSQRQTHSEASNDEDCHLGTDGLSVRDIFDGKTVT